MKEGIKVTNNNNEKMYGYKVYENGSYTFQDVTVGNKTYNHTLVDSYGKIISGYDYFVGKDEKRRNDKIIHIDFPFTCGNYSLFYKGTMEILITVCDAIDFLLNNPEAAKKEKNKRYKILLNSLHIVEHRNTAKRKSKLNGINSLSTSCLDNAFCVERMKNNDSICCHCYSATQQKTQLALQDVNIINGIILRNIVIPEYAWKKYFPKEKLSKFFRIESFGDVQNKNQVLNYINFCNAFKRIHFAAWTKNTGIYHFSFMEAGKPENLSFVVSSNNINKAELYHFKNDSNVNHVFTVYDKKYIQENNIKINCGGLSCMECIKKHRNCYFTDTEKEISEELK